MRVEAARYTGTDDKGQQFVDRRQPRDPAQLRCADRRHQRNVRAARPGAGPGRLIAANQGRYNLDTQQIAIDGPVKVAGADGYRLDDPRRDRRPQAAASLRSAGPVAGAMRLGQFQAGQVRADLGSRTVVLDGGARLKIVQGAVR